MRHIYHSISSARRLRRLAFASAMGLLVLGTMIVVPFADTTTYADDPVIIENSNITMNIVNDSAVAALVVSDAGGTFAASGTGTDGLADTRAKFSVTTTSPDGYTLRVASSDASSTLTGNGGELQSIESSISRADFSEDPGYNGYWGYQPSKIDSALNEVFLPAPSIEGDLIDHTTSANAEANEYSIAIGARADYEVPAGAYSRTFTLTSVANVPDYVDVTVNFSADEADSISFIGAAYGTTTVTTPGITVALPVSDTYTVKANYSSDDAKAFYWETDAGGTLTHSDLNPTGYTLNSDATITVRVSEAEVYTLNYVCNPNSYSNCPEGMVGTSATGEYTFPISTQRPVDQSAGGQSYQIFMGWNTQPDTDSIEYAPGGSITVHSGSNETNLYIASAFNAKLYYETESSETQSDWQYCYANESDVDPLDFSSSTCNVTINHTDPYKENHAFLYWYSDDQTYQNGDTFTLDTSHGGESWAYVNAAWTPIYKLEYYADDSTTAEPVEIATCHDETISGEIPTSDGVIPGSCSFTITSSTPTKDGYTFLGWHEIDPSSEEPTEVYAAGDTFTPANDDPSSDNRVWTLYAIWEELLPTP